MTKKTSILTIAISGLLSIIIATAWINFGAIELGALIYFIIPLLTAIGTIILLLLMKFTIVKNKTWPIIILTTINILTGHFMRLNFYYHIVNL